MGRRQRQQWMGPWMAGWAGPGSGPPPWAGHHRARRGDVRWALLHVLEDGPRHGYELIRELEARSGGRWRPSAGSVYPTLQLLEDEGLVTSEDREGKRVYAVTDAGRQALAEQQQGGHQWTPPWEGADDEHAPLREAAMSLMAAAMQAASSGNEQHRQVALDALNQARRTIYAALAEG